MRALLSLLLARVLAPALVLALLGPAAAHAASPEGFAPRLESAVVARMRVVPEADAPLQEAASCASRITTVRVRLVRESRPLLVGLPGGLVLVSTGLLAAVESDAELAAAIAHEAGHLKREDLLDRLTKAYGAERLVRIGQGRDGDVLSGLAANIASGGVLVRHGSLSEQGAEDAAREAGCAGGLARILSRTGSQRRHRRQDRQAHPVALSEEAGPAAFDPSIAVLQRVREAAGALP